MLGQDVDTPPVITINNYELEVLHQFTYLGSIISDNLSLDVARWSVAMGSPPATLMRAGAEIISGSWYEK